MGDKMGRVHLGRQDLSELQTRKMKGLKRGRDEDEKMDVDVDEDEDVIIASDEDIDGGGVELKRIKIAEV